MSLPWFIRPNGGQVAAIDHPEGSVAQRHLVSGVVDVLHPWKPAHPLSWSIIGEATQVHDDDAVCCLESGRLIGVEGGRHMQLGTYEPHELPPKRGGEHGSLSDTMDWGTP